MDMNGVAAIVTGGASGLGGATAARLAKAGAKVTLFDLNADLGEGYGAYACGDDAAILSIVTSANVACGLHAGDPEIMAETFALARARGVR